MKTVTKKLYEAMFLIDSAKAAADWDEVMKNIQNILEKSNAEIVSIKKWDETKLAYKINGKTRGTYILCYFRAEPESIQDIERDVRLSEQIMRVLILCAEDRETSILRNITENEQDVEKETTAMPAEKSEQKEAQEIDEKDEALQVSSQQKAEQTEEPKETPMSGAKSEQVETTSSEQADEQHQQEPEPETSS